MDKITRRSLSLLHDLGAGGADYLARAVQPNGRFTYLLNSQTGRREAGYNLLRHAGALWALGLWRSALPANFATPAIDAAAEYLRRKVSTEWGAPPHLVSREKVKLGGSALMLLALMARDPDLNTDRDLCLGLADYLVSQQSPNGRFQSARARDGAVSPFGSAYYSGQAMLALTRLYSLTSRQEHLEAALRGAYHLRVVDPLPLQAIDAADHWTVLAFEALHEHAQDRWLADRVLASGDRICSTLLEVDAAGFSGQRQGLRLRRCGYTWGGARRCGPDRPPSGRRSPGRLVTCSACDDRRLLRDTPRRR